MPAEPNVAGMPRLIYVVGGAAIIAWGFWGADPGWTQWIWLALGGLALILGLIGYSPVHAFFINKSTKAS